jgi:hypothetical protein
MHERYARVTDLFVTGTELVLDDGGGEPVLMWIQKPNPFEREEARKHGRVASARMTLALEDPDSDEMAVFRARSARATDQQLRDAIVEMKFSAQFVAAQNELRDDKDWAEKVEIIERSPEQLAGRDDDDPEVKQLATLNQAYLGEFNKRLSALRAKDYAELDGVASDELRSLYERAYIEAAASAVSLAEFRLTELFYAVRACAATRDGDGPDARWRHDHCGGHRERIFADRAELQQLPEQLTEQLEAAIQKVTMTPRDAKNSGRGRSSSASSPAPNEPEESKPSTRKATSRKRGGTSQPQPATL